jgi:nucleotide-binding universal stress UspA family protein/predicted Zn-ribbon and HTH transcriptional regulator
MYSSIYVALDNSEHSDTASTVALDLAAAFDARLIGMHVYAARMHDYRFKQMEYTLPEEYQDEAELLRQRRIHDSLISTGLELISDSYTDVLRYRSLERNVPFEARMRDGRNWEELVADIDESPDVDLVVMGALGTGAVKESQLGSVTDRVARRIRRDLLVIRSTGDCAPDGGILVAIDGSPQSFAGLRTALAIGRALDKRVEAVAVYDPYLHYAVFNGIVDVLSEKASKVFRFKEQEALHEEIIDTGLAKIYESHLRVARATAAEVGVDLPITLLDGKAFERVLRHARETRAWLLVLGRIGVHSNASMDMGSNTEQLLRLAPCHVLVSSGSYTPPIDVRADASVVWTPEAEDRMASVPAGARGLARTAVLRWAMERGHSVVSSGDVAVALDELMPFARTMRTIAATAAVVDEAERAMLTEPPLEEARAVCRTCGYAARSDEPQRCPVCGGEADGFERLDSNALRAAAAGEGDAAATAFDGAKLGWTVEARRVLQQLPAGYLRRRVKAIVEKHARTRRLPAITAEVAAQFVAPELDALDENAGPHRAPIGVERHTGPQVEQRRRLPWTDEADDRIERIPAGFLRNLASEQIERLALALGAPRVGVLHVEAGIAEARARMQRESGAAGAADANGCPVATAPAAGSGCPVHRDPATSTNAIVTGSTARQGPGLNEITAPVVDDLGRRMTAQLPDG